MVSFHVTLLYDFLIGIVITFPNMITRFAQANAKPNLSVWPKFERALHKSMEFVFATTDRMTRSVNSLPYGIAIL